jgi:hypothetical protein
MRASTAGGRRVSPILRDESNDRRSSHHGNGNMEILYNRIAGPHRYPMARVDVERAVELLYPSVRGRLAAIRFICSNNSTRLARLVTRKSGSTITINFCTQDDVSRLASNRNDYLRQIRACGGEPSVEEGKIRWSPESARRFAVFLLSHEVGHLLFAERMGEDVGRRDRGSAAEEAWCDSFALESVRQYVARVSQHSGDRQTHH